jgi:uncharacterized protein YdeI (YjbR/CyaY-like superfamily)
VTTTLTETAGRHGSRTLPRPEPDPITFADADQFEAWLADHHHRATDVWMKIAKKGARQATISQPDALDVALCFGWIDSHRRTYDGDHYMQRYSPRRPKSAWSQVNVDKVEVLVAAGRMREAGAATVRAAKADGRWEAAYQSQRNATMPDDLAAALARDERARARFDQLGRTERYTLFLRLMKAPTPGDRAIQLERMIRSLAADR